MFTRNSTRGSTLSNSNRGIGWTTRLDESLAYGRVKWQLLQNRLSLMIHKFTTFSKFNFHANRIVFDISLNFFKTKKHQPYRFKVSKIFFVVLQLSFFTKCKGLISDHRFCHIFIFFIFKLFLHVSKYQYFFSNLNFYCSNLLYVYEKPPGTSWKSNLLPKIVLTFHCLSKLLRILGLQSRISKVFLDY